MLVEKRLQLGHIFAMLEKAVSETLTAAKPLHPFVCSPLPVKQEGTNNE
jgi:hypothetical protein